MQVQQLTGSILTYAIALFRSIHGFLKMNRLQSLFDKTSWRICLSRLKSATTTETVCFLPPRTLAIRRSSHPCKLFLPTVERLLVDAQFTAGLLHRRSRFRLPHSIGICSSVSSDFFKVISPKMMTRFYLDFSYLPRTSFFGADRDHEGVSPNQIPQCHACRPRTFEFFAIWCG